MKPEPRITDQGLPLCTEECPHHDGKRCEMMGFRPDRICEPAVLKLIDQRRTERLRCAQVCHARAESHELVRTTYDAILGGSALVKALRDEAMRCAQAIEALEDL